ncbi:cytochrome c oxidase subunit 3 [Pedobacter suwonensis]|uniref:cytochrome c oxidase subunit 3 n=1 Tax=Pedobacter suwonensis TaxID=332999 RepID=UPI0036B3CA5C
MQNNIDRTNPKAKVFIVWLIILSSFILFTALTSVLFLADYSISMPPMFIVSTALIVLSSIALHISNMKFKMLQFKAHKRYMWLTAVLGLLFLTVQLIAWHTMVEHGAASSANYNAIVYILVIAHSLHVMMGLLILLYTIFSLNGTPHQRIGNRVKMTTIFWQFIGFLWLYLYFLFLILL